MEGDESMSIDPRQVLAESRAKLDHLRSFL